MSKDKKRNSFSSALSPWFRRNSFLSPTMILNENFSVYDSPSFYADSSSFNIISLKECQGFVFNQDLFASPYQQLRSLANERRIRAHSFLGKPRSRSFSRTSQSKSKTPTPLCVSQVRRNTSYHATRPLFLAPNATTDPDADGDTTADPETVSHEDGDATTPVSYLLYSDDDNAVVDEYDEYDDSDYDETNGYPGDTTNRTYKVHVTEIVVNENDNIFPS